jgi:hypothetical protein
MAYWVTFPFTNREAAEEFLAEMHERGWAGAILDVDGVEIAATTGPRLRLVDGEKKKTFSVDVKHLEE